MAAVPSDIDQYVADVAADRRGALVRLRDPCRDEPGLDMGKGCLRHRIPEAIDFDLVRSVPHATATSRHRVC
ncbi:MAG TPA: hypothetical protein VGX25_35535 [Actinophytocola sp.]|uniref:hypothetical protein n=1 Tax=Actinophytocola sp. TaxID=1872138 RepID=UPI002DDD21C2|nr:hypothetical protein [Actinophytocola sp.]HEV2784728.1 hypothetical protein [Actinophytocola sp.]